MVARLTGRSPGAFRSTAGVVLAYGVAMGFLEAAVVVYLRAAVGLGPSGLALIHNPAVFGALGNIEVAREMATLVMIAAVGWLAGSSHLERLAWAAVVFGSWDIVYYLGLRLMAGWPASVGAWDVLFLVPVPWVGPVWAPIVVSVALVGFGLAAAQRLRAGRPIGFGLIRAIALAAGGALIVLSFVVDAGRVPTADAAPWSSWPFFWGGMVLATAAAAGALIEGVRPHGQELAPP